MNVRLIRLKARNFRGIRDQEIPLNGRNLLLVGENGSGKSSFVDALEYVFTGELERLKRRDVKESQSIPFVESGNNDTFVELVCQVDGNEVPLRVDYPCTTPVVPKRLGTWFELARSRPFILRRAQILRFVEAKGADRYKQVSTLIGLDEVDEIEKTWRDLENQWKRRVQEAVRDEASKVEELGSVAGTEEAESSRLVEAVNQRLEKLGVQPISEMQELPQAKAAIWVGAEVNEAAQKAQRLLSCAAKLGEIAHALTRLPDLYQAFFSERQALVQERETLKEALFQMFLEKGKSLLEQHPEIDKCPFCHEPIRDRGALLDDVRRRLDALESVQRKKDSLGNRLNSLRSEVSTACSLIQKCRQDEEANRVQELLAELESGLAGFLGILKQEVLAAEFPAQEDVCRANWVLKTAALLQEKENLEKQARALQPSKIEQERMESVIWLSRIEEKWRELEQRRRTLKRVQRICEQVGAVHAALVRAREKRLEEIHARIEKLVDNYCKRLHPDEGYGDVQLPIESQGRGVGLRTSFYNVDDTHPLGFYSEAHLDSLGIAFFLAFIKEFNGDLRLLVLDDVLTTMDRSHRQRMANLICDEFSDYQMLLTTHDRLWAEELLNTMRATRLQSLALHLKPWDIRRGVDWLEFLEERWDEYRRRAGSHVQSAVADVGRDLEKFLCKMRYNLLLSVPARTGDSYTIGDLYDPFFSWFRKHSVQHPDVAFDSKLESVKGQLDVYWRLRNWAGAHYNEWGESLSSSEAWGFIDAVEGLVGMFRCPRCRSLVEYEEQSSVLFCSRCRGKPDGTCWRVVERKQG